MQSSILMVPYVKRLFDFPRQVLTRKNEGFLSAVYSLFHSFKTIYFNLAFCFCNRTSAAVFQTTGREVKTGLCDKWSIWLFKTEVQDWFLRKLVLTKLTSKVLTKPKPLRRNLGTRTKPSAPECPALCRVWVQLWEHSRLKESAVPFRP